MATRTFGASWHTNRSKSSIPFVKEIKTVTGKLLGLVSLVSALVVNPLLAQDEPQIIPPSPNASAIQKFTEMPVSAYTGLPSISVPIYEGGAITRTVMGNDDFDPAFNYFDPSVLSFPEGYKPQSFFTQGCVTDFEHPTTQDIQQVDVSSYISSSANEIYEFEADQYAYNFVGESGKFMLERDYSAVLAKQKKLDIQVTA